MGWIPLTRRVREVRLFERLGVGDEEAKIIAARLADAIVRHIDLAQLILVVEVAPERVRANVTNVVAPQRELPDAGIGLERLGEGGAPSAGKVVVRKVEIGEHAIVADRRGDVLERAGLDVHVQSELVVLHVECLDVLIVAQALEDGLAACSAHATVLERDHLVVQHRYELLDGDDVLLAAHFHVDVHARGIYELRRENAIRAILLVRFGLRLQRVGGEHGPIRVGAFDAMRDGDAIPEVGLRHGQKGSATEVQQEKRSWNPMEQLFRR